MLENVVRKKLIYFANLETLENVIYQKLLTSFCQCLDLIGENIWMFEKTWLTKNCLYLLPMFRPHWWDTVAASVVFVPPAWSWPPTLSFRYFICFCDCFVLFCFSPWYSYFFRLLILLLKNSIPPSQTFEKKPKAKVLFWSKHCSRPNPALLLERWKRWWRANCVGALATGKNQSSSKVDLVWK